VILRRGNYFAEQCLISNRPHWGTATSLALSVLLTLTRENFDKYTKIAPELKELFLRRERAQQEEEEALAQEEAPRKANRPAAGPALGPRGKPRPAPRPPLPRRQERRPRRSAA
jgi:CRP-like cAMP-binding protein